MTRQYVNKHLKGVMYTILDKISRLKNVDFSKIDNDKVYLVVCKTAYDILISYKYLISNDDYILGDYLDSEIHNEDRWLVSNNKVRLYTVEGLEVNITVSDEKSLDGLSAEVSAITQDGEKLNVQETSTSTKINVKNNKKEVKVINKRFVIVEDNKEKVIKRQTASGLNTAIMFLRDKTSQQLLYKNN